MPTSQKEQLVQEVAEALRNSGAVYLLSFSGLSVPEMNQLRGQVLAAGARLQVVKNRLLKLALAAAEAPALDDYLTGPTLVAFCGDDPVAPAQAVAGFADQHPGLALKGGLVESRVVTGDQAQQIAKLPPKEQILAEAVGALASPASGLVGVLDAALSELVYLTEAYVEKLQGEGAAA